MPEWVRREIKMDKRNLFKTATIRFDTKVFKAGEIVSVSVKYRMAGPWVFECRLGDRVDLISEGFLSGLCL